MSKKFFSKFVKVLPILCLAGAPALANLSSCSTNEIIKHNIWLPNSTFTVNVHSFTIPVYFNFQPNGSVKVQLKNNSPDIRIQGVSILVTEGKSNLTFIISESVVTTQWFDFDIEFKYSDVDQKEHKFTIFNVLAYYTNEEIVEKDIVTLDSNYSSAVNQHIFKYVCYFPYKPISDTIHVTISNKSSNLFDLVKTDYQILDGNIPYIEVYLSLDMSVFKKSVYSFDMTLSFMNSFSKSQEEKFSGCSFLYDVVKTEDVPLDYLNLEPINDGHYILKGLKQNVSPLEGGKFKVLNIPDNVDIITENAFADEQWFSGIRKIIVPASVEEIQSRAFGGCNNLTELDITAYKDQTPKWISSTDLFNQNTFNTVGGFVWADHYPNLEELNQNMIGWGLPEAWSGYNSDMYTSKDDFAYKEDAQSEITGLNEAKLENFKHYKVIRVPDFVQKIDNEAFNYLKENPYESPASTPENPIYETRELVLGEQFNSFDCDCFREGGFSGNILLYCNSATDLSTNAFSNMQNYGWPGLLDVVTTPILLILATCSNVTSIGDYAFNFVPITNKTISFKKTISSIGSFSFQGNEFEKIIFNDNITNVGMSAFANIFLEPVTPHLSYVDLSCYHKIVNPTALEPERTRIPDWFNHIDCAFEGSCLPEGTIKVSKEVWDEIQSKDNPGQWIQNFLQNHKIPSGWQVVTE